VGPSGLYKDFLMYFLYASNVFKINVE